MDRLQAMRILVRVAETGSFSAVAREEGSSQSAISKQVAALESYLGVRLLARTTRAVTLTDEGMVYLKSAQRIVRDTEEAEDALRNDRGQITGRLRLGASHGFGKHVLFPIVQRFMQEHPQLEVDLQLKDSFVDVIADGLDAVVRVGELDDSSLLARRVGTAQRSVIANAALAAQLNQDGDLPTVPEDLSRHNCVIYTGLNTPNTWVFESPPKPAPRSEKDIRVRVSGRFMTNNTEVIRDAVLSGLGIGFTPNWFFAKQLITGEVVRLLPGFVPRPLPIHILYPDTRRDSAKILALTQAVQHGLANSA